MPRAKGNDLCEIYGYAPDDTSETARKQWKSQECPFVGGTCIKHSHPQRDGQVVVYGTCSVLNKTRRGKEEVVLCPQRLYANNYEPLRNCLADAVGKDIPLYLAAEYSRKKQANALPTDHGVLIGQKSGREIQITNPGVISLSIDWVIIRVVRKEPVMLIPCEVQSIDTTGNYHANWQAYAEEKKKIPDSKHGMNWANVWKRLIPQLILKGSIAKTSKLCNAGLYFVVPDRVYVQFEKLIGKVPEPKNRSSDSLTVMTYSPGDDVPVGKVRPLKAIRTIRMSVEGFSKAFASGSQLPLGTQLDERALQIYQSL